ncbi:MAG: hypothetical protein H6R19_1907 [Proteobacteria bacterium]|nr:hypothetical protein [Pseudomonadota bacterium]
MDTTPRLRTLFLLFLRVGSTAFGMGMLQSLRETLLRHRLVSEQELAEDLALVLLQEIPDCNICLQSMTGR